MEPLTSDSDLQHPSLHVDNEPRTSDSDLEHLDLAPQPRGLGVRGGDIPQLLDL